MLHKTVALLQLAQQLQPAQPQVQQLHQAPLQVVQAQQHVLPIMTEDHTIDTEMVNAVVIMVNIMNVAVHLVVVMVNVVDHLAVNVHQDAMAIVDQDHNNNLTESNLHGYKFKY